MAFPTIVDADTKNGVQASNSLSWTLTYPTNLVAGDLILAAVAMDGTPTLTWPANWIASATLGPTAVTMAVAKKISLGTETGTFTLSLSATEQGAWRIFRITGWEGTIGTSFSSDSNGLNGAVTRSNTSATGTDANPNPPSLDPGGWATEDTLWLAVCGIDTSRTISVYPLADRNTADVSGGSTGATLGICTANSATGSLDPSTFTQSASDDWVALTVAVRPAASKSLLPPRRHRSLIIR